MSDLNNLISPRNIQSYSSNNNRKKNKKKQLIPIQMETKADKKQKLP